MSGGEALYRRSCGHGPVHEGLDPVRRGQRHDLVHGPLPHCGQTDMTENITFATPSATSDHVFFDSESGNTEALSFVIGHT